MPCTKHHSKLGEPRGRITGTAKPIVLPGGICIRGGRPILLVEVKTGSEENRKMFSSYCKQNAISCHVAGHPEYPEVWVFEMRDPTTIYEVSGGLALEGLTELPCVIEWWYPLSLSY